MPLLSKKILTLNSSKSSKTANQELCMRKKRLLSRKKELIKKTKSKMKTSHNLPFSLTSKIHKFLKTLTKSYKREEKKTVLSSTGQTSFQNPN